MPLARFALYERGVEIYLAPTADDSEAWHDSIRHIARESRAFVISSCAFQRASSYPTDIALAEGDDLLGRGGSAIVAPDGTYLAGPLWDDEGVLYADLDPARALPGAAALRPCRPLPPPRCPLAQRDPARVSGNALVVGAGVTGASVARELALRGFDVTLAEQYASGTVRSASGGDTRLLRAAHGDGDWYMHLAWRARSLWLQLQDETGTRLWEPTGLAWFAHRGDGFEARSRTALAAAGIPHDWRTPAEAAGLFPSLGLDGLQAVLWEPEAGVLHARRATQLLASEAERLGVRTVAARIAPEDEPEADVVVWACGAWLPRPLPGRGRDPRRAARRPLPRRRRVLAGHTRLGRVRRGLLRPRRRRRPRREGRAGRGERRGRSGHPRTTPAPRARGGSARVHGEAVPLARRCTGDRRARLSVRPLGRQSFRLRAPSRPPVVVAVRRRVGPRLQTRSGARRVHRGLRRGTARAGVVPRARRTDRRRRASHEPSELRRTPRFEREQQLAEQVVQLHLLLLRERGGEERLLAALHLDGRFPRRAPFGCQLDERRRAGRPDREAGAGTRATRGGRAGS